MLSKGVAFTPTNYNVNGLDKENKRLKQEIKTSNNNTFITNYVLPLHEFKV